jgi:cold shock CspA family protein
MAPLPGTCILFNESDDIGFIMCEAIGKLLAFKSHNVSSASASKIKKGDKVAFNIRGKEGEETACDVRILTDETEHVTEVRREPMGASPGGASASASLASMFTPGMLKDLTGFNARAFSDRDGSEKKTVASRGVPAFIPRYHR